MTIFQQLIPKGDWQSLVNLLRRRPRKRPPLPQDTTLRQAQDATPYVSFRVEGAVKGGAVIWVLDRQLNERSRYRVWWN